MTDRDRTWESETPAQRDAVAAERRREFPTTRRDYEYDRATQVYLERMNKVQRGDPAAEGCRLCLSTPCRPDCPAGASELVARHVLRMPEPLLAEARAYHFPDGILLASSPPAPLWRRLLRVARAVLVLGLTLAAGLAVLGAVILGVAWVIG